MYSYPIYRIAVHNSKCQDVIILSANSFLSFKKNESGASMVTAILGLAVTLLIGILILVSIQTPLQTQIDAANDTTASSTATTVLSLAWAGIGLLAIVIIILVGKYMMNIIGSM